MNSACFDFLSSHGIPLSPLGLSEFAVLAKDAAAFIELLRQENLPVLGGDVYLKVQSTVEVGYANWHVDKLPHESHRDFVNRSCDFALDYVRKYKPPESAQPCFGFVI
jgi:hypothetical protein